MKKNKKLVTSLIGKLTKRELKKMPVVEKN